eukprot:2102587-Amphidinium_carterae.1
MKSALESSGHWPVFKTEIQYVCCPTKRGGCVTSRLRSVSSSLRQMVHLIVDAYSKLNLFGVLINFFIDSYIATSAGQVSMKT